MLLPLFVVAAIIAVQLFLSLDWNNGTLILARDDPYVHLDVAAQLWRTGLYGVNDGIAASASSSILWPFLLAPFANTGWMVEITMAITILGSLAATLVLGRICALLLDKTVAGWRVPALTIFLSLLLNIPGLALMGMEHSWQIFLTLLGILGTLQTLEGQKPRWWLWAALILAPLIRYENAITSTALLGLLLWDGYAKRSLAAFAAILAGIAAFSFFLLHLGLEPFPGSIIVKKIELSENWLPFFIAQIDTGRHSPVGIFVLMLGPVMGLIALLRWRDWRTLNWALPASLSASSFLHLLLGRISGVNAPRYEYYLLTYGLLMVLWMAKQNPPRPRIAKLGMVLLFPICLPGTYFSLYDASKLMHCIYTQQYQMHRLAATFWTSPVAVNDSGLVGYNNPHFVLELIGLSDRDVRRLRWYEKDPDYAEKMVTARGVDLIMVFPGWFPRKTLRHWTPVGILDCQPCYETISNGAPAVMFFTPDAANLSSIQTRLRPWIDSLPKGATFRMIAPPPIAPAPG